MKSSSKRPRFPGLRLSALDRRTLAQQTRDGRAVSARTWKRIRILELLHEQWALGDVAEAVGTYRREVRRVGWRYLDCGVRAALSDDPRPKPPKLLDTRQEAAIVALVCGPPPDGYARWTVRVTTEETKRRGIVADVGRETVRQVLAHHELKPWRKKMWCVPTLDAEYIEHMEDVLNVLARPYDAREPVVTFDERPVALRGASRPGRPMAAGHIAREDYEYVRTGTANIYCIVEPNAGRHVTHATRDRKAPRFVAALQRIARRYPTAKTIHLIMDNLNLHGPGSLFSTLGPVQGAALWARFTPHYTPKHGSWLNPAEIEASLWSRECHGRERVDTFEALRDRTRAWTARADRARRKIIWRFTTAKARRVFRYKKKRSTMSRSRH